MFRTTNDDCALRYAISNTGLKITRSTLRRTVRASYSGEIRVRDSTRNVERTIAFSEANSLDVANERRAVPSPDEFATPHNLSVSLASLKGPKVAKSPSFHPGRRARRGRRLRRGG